MNTSGVSAVLNRLIASTGTSESELARRIEIPIATLNKLKTGRVVDPKASTLLLIANYFSITVDQLIGHAPFEVLNTRTLSYVPVLKTSDLLGTKVNQLTYDNHKEWVSFERNDNSFARSLFALNVLGDAMWPYFDENTTIIVDQDLEVANKKCVVVYLAESNEIVLRQVFIDGNSLIVKPINSMFKTVTLTPNDRVLGVVIHSIRAF